MDARHNFIAKKCVAALGCQMHEMEYWICDNAVMEKIGAFFKGGGPSAIVVCAAEDGKPYLYEAGQGMLVNGASHRAVFFQRIAPKGIMPNTVESDIAFGEIKRGIVEDLHAQLEKVYLPLVWQQEDWQEDPRSGSLQAELMTVAEDFGKALTSALDNMKTAVRLDLPEPEYLNLNMSQKSFQDAAMNTDVVATHVRILQRWCGQMEALLEESMASTDKKAKKGADEGPRTELAFWRDRSYKFSTIIDQLKCQEYKIVLGVLKEAKALDDDAHRAVTTWRALDNKITDAGNEAKDNVKFLSTLDKYVDVLYQGSTTDIEEILPALMTNVKMMQKISRFYNSPERMTTLCWRITNQIIANCKQQILTGGRIWDQDPDEVCEKMRACQRLYINYLEAYEDVKHRTVLIKAPEGVEDFEFDEEKIFGHMELFVKRLDKVIDIFTTISQYRFMGARAIEGMSVHIEAFEQVVEETQRKPYDILDHTKTSFDRDYMDFCGKINKVETDLQAFVNESFEVIPNTEMALDLLQKFYGTIRRKKLQDDLEIKHMVIFQNYGLDLDFVQKTYEKLKTTPPMVRTIPPVSGSIIWSRQLLRRIQMPMDQFQTNEATMSMKEGKKIIRTYNKVARALIQFETMWQDAWCQSVEASKAGLHATLMTKHPHNPRIFANFDPEILQLIREAKCLAHLGMDIPENARLVLMQDVKFKNLYGQILSTLKEHEYVVGRVNPVIKGLMQYHLDELEVKVNPGLTTITWTSLNIENYFEIVEAALNKMDDLVSKMNDIIENRIEKNLKEISKTSLVDLAPEKFPFVVSDFVSLQEQFVKDQSSFMDGKNLEVELAVQDLIDLVNNATAAEGKPNVALERNPTAVPILVRHYNRLMYHAILASMKLSFNQIKSRIVKPKASIAEQALGKKPKELPAFFIADIEVDHSLAHPNAESRAVVMKPSLPDIQDTINRTAIQVLRSAKRVIQWGQDRSGEGDEPLLSFYDELAREKEVCKLVLLLTGSLLGAEIAVNTYLEQFDAYKFLWERNMQTEYNDFLATDPTLEDFDDELTQYVTYEAEVNAFPAFHNIGVLSLKSANIKQHLGAFTNLWKTQYTKNLLEMAREDLQGLVEYMANTIRKFGMEYTNLEDVRKMVELLRELREKESVVEWEFGPLEEKYVMLERYGVKSLNQEELHQVSELRKQWKKVKELTNGVTDDLLKNQKKFKKDLIKDRKKYIKSVKTYRADYEKKGPGIKGIAPGEALERLNKHEGLFADLDRKYTQMQAGEVLFGMPTTNLDEMTKTKKELKLLRQLYGLYENVEKTMEGYNEIMWVDVLQNIDSITNEVDGFQKACKNMPKALKEWDAYQELKKSIDDLLETVPLLQALSNKAMRERHWDQVREVTGRDLVMDPETFKVGDLLREPKKVKNKKTGKWVTKEKSLLEVAEDIEEISMGSTKELNVELKLIEIEEQWADKIFFFGGYKSRSGVYILKGVETQETQELLEESLMNLGGMASSRYALPFKDSVDEWLAKLGETQDVTERWLYLQMLWMNLEAVFTGGDIAKQLPQDSKRFVSIDKTWVKLMAKAYDQRNVIGLCYGNDMLKFLQPLIEGLETCQRSLASYLESKRALFPRFYFVSDPVLLEILSQGSDPPAIQPYFQACFDSIDWVDFDEKDKKKIVGINAQVGSEKETIEFTQVVAAEGNIEEWLAKIELEMQRSIHDVVRQGAVDCLAQDIETFIANYNAQTCILGIQMQWTMESQTAISTSRQDKKIMAETAAKWTGLMSTLCELTTNDKLGKRDRRNVETLITIEVHQKDVFDDLVKKKLKDAGSFDWMQQLRFYYRTDLDACLAECCDRPFHYSNEFLGCEERLVITPLTDRCYVTLTQALGMIKGGAPAGPAGTGKTETTKDLARALAKYCVVTNCGPEMDIRATGKIFKGIAMAGAWGCFDEFNRIELEVLSVCAQQIACVLNAIKDKVKEFQFLDGQILAVNPVCGYFITMNPGYAGRQELPENLKDLFRGVTMMVPDRMIIMKVKLAAAGFQDYQTLCVKFHVLYRLCEQQLSKQPHYDFGLRNILSVLRTAGTQLRNEKKIAEKTGGKMKSELYLLCRTLRDMNMSKFVAEDVSLFLSLINDLFPGLNPEKAVFPEEEKAIEECCIEANLQLHPTWVGKIVQLYETYLVRHGIMVVGTAGCGKTRIIQMLKEALSKVTNKHTVIKMNPKGVTPKQMYGFQDPVANEWTEGIFTALWKKSNDPRKKGVNQWMVMDGPVDAIWIEDLNTVLDDNKMLTCANGDRIPMLASMKIMFEPENLNNASPATVSRAGIIFVSPNDLGWEPIIQSWLQTRTNKAEREVLAKFLVKYAKASLTWCLEGGARQVMGVEDMNLVKTFLACLEGILPELKEKDAPLDEAAMVRIIAFACLWSFGGLYEAEDRKKYEEVVLRQLSAECLPEVDAAHSSYDYTLDVGKGYNWTPWSVAPLSVENPETFDYASLLVPTMDAVRLQFLMGKMLQLKVPFMMVGGPGTAKTSIAMMYIEQQDKATTLHKRMNFSSATTPLIFQRIIESSVEKRSGKIFGPPANKKLLVFLDDVSMPEINKWGDQITLEIIRQLVELGYVWNLEKSKAGEQQFIEDLLYVLAMNHPGGGKNDIPHRMKRHCANINVPMPAMSSINQIFGAILKLRFNAKDFKPDVLNVAQSLIPITMELYQKTKTKLLPTPAKFHYIFNLRDVSRVFQGIMTIPKEIQKKPTNCKFNPAQFLLAAWRHECQRVYEDKLVDKHDKAWLDTTLIHLIRDNFDDVVDHELIQAPIYMADFLRDAPEDPETGEPMGPRPRMYEAVESLESLNERCTKLMHEMNDGLRVGKMFLVLFDDALMHLARIARIIMMPRGSGLLVGVGGSGKQSLTRLATYIAEYERFQVTVSKTYNTNNLLEDIKNQYMKAGFAKPVTFVFTDAEVKEEGFLEYVNMILSTGEIPGLLPKDEQEAMIGELSAVYEKETKKEPNRDAVLKYFYDRVRANLHMVLCFSPVGEKFRERALKFPALFSGTTIDWFLPWPVEALQKVARSFIQDFSGQVESPVIKDELVNHMGAVHNMVANQCSQYFVQFRRNVYVTPKSYLSFIDTYKQVYAKKFKEVEEDSVKIANGLVKLKEAEEDVAVMQVELAETEKVLAVTSERIEKMVVNLRDKSGKAEKVKAEVTLYKNDLSEKAAKIQADRDDTNRDLEAAKPALFAAEKALDAIKPDDIKSLKALKNPPNIIKRIFDAVIILRRDAIDPLKIDPDVKTKGGNDTILASWGTSARMMSQPKFLDEMKAFNTDTITDETCELLFPYMEMDDFTLEAASKASGNVAGLCDWCRAMVNYYFIAKFVAPKIEALKMSEAKLSVAMAELKVAEENLAEKEAEVAGLNAEFDKAMAEKKVTQDQADATSAKMSAATKLIQGLAGEKIRWTAQSKEFNSVLTRLVGDVALACAFISYCGPFNATYRDKLVDTFQDDMVERGMPVSETVNVVKFLVDNTQLAKWQMEGLPTDKLSLENGIMTTKATRWPIMIDPQNQANAWIKNKEEPNGLCSITLTDKRFRNELERTMGDGMPLLIEHIEEEIDPVLDPIMNKLVIRTGKFCKINLPDKEGCDYSDNFRLFFTTKLANPHYTPEMSAVSTIIDFTVTMQGLEDQLLSIVVLKERPDLEEQRQTLMRDITQYKSKVSELEAQLLAKLSSVQGNLLDDKEILDVLNNTKATSQEVSTKLASAAETQDMIQITCEDYRAVATRGSIIYFLFTECSAINPMYQISLSQFLELFDISMVQAEADDVVKKRCQNIIDDCTYLTFFYITRGVFERHKLLYSLLLCMKIQLKAGTLSSVNFNTLLKGGAALDIKSCKRKPAEWIPDNAWLHLCALQMNVPEFKELLDKICNSLDKWQAWFDHEDPEAKPIPDYEGKLTAYQRLLIVRCIREDRTLVSSKEYVKEVLGSTYLVFKPLDIEHTWNESTNMTPLIFLLSPGSNPNAAIELLGKRNKIRVDAISMGQGQEIKAAELIEAGVENGSWVMLQNCHLGLAYMRTIEQTLDELEDKIHAGFRLWITSEPHPLFPIGLLQMSIKMTDEPPSGIKAGLRKSYAWLNQDWIEAVNRDEWRPMLFALCFMHTIVQERRKFGPLGFCIPYEFNMTDLEASSMYMKTHMTEVELKKGQVSWPAVQYMTCEVQYGGRITDDLDRRLFNTYGTQYLHPKIFEPEFEFAEGYKLMKFPEVTKYRVAIEDLRDDDHPNIFGMHANADLTYRTKVTKELLTTIVDIQPKDSGGGDGGPTREEIVLEQAANFLQNMPKSFDPVDVKKCLSKLGVTQPLIVHLKQEIDRMQIIIDLTRSTLKSLELAIAGTVIMTPDLIQALNSIFDARVPPKWLAKSWKSPTLGLWFNNLANRTAELVNWKDNGRPKSYWLTGFFNAQGFLTAVQQEVTRKNAGWSLDDVVVHTEITNMEKEDVEKKDRLETGVYLWGLFLEAAAWDKRKGVLVEAPPKKLFCPVPCMFVTAVKRSEAKTQGQYNCPCYTIPARTGLNYVFTANVRSEDPQSKWILRGCALMCSKD